MITDVARESTPGYNSGMHNSAILKPETRGLHPLLRGNTQHADIWLYFTKVNGDEKGLTAAEVRDGTQMAHSTVMARFTEMVNEGLLIPTGEMRFTAPKYERKAKVYRRVLENEIGHGRDQLKINIEIKVNQYGEYSIGRVEIDGQSASDARHSKVGILQTIANTSHTIRVPKPTEPYKLRRAAVDVDMSNDLTLEGDYTKVVE